MPAGTATSDAMAVDQSGQRSTEGGADASQTANATVSDDGRGGKWAKDNQKGKGRTATANAPSAYLHGLCE